MNHLSPAGRRLAGRGRAGRRLAVAVAVTLAVTAGTAMTSAPALAAPRTATATASEEQAGPFAIDVNAHLLGAGATGFLTYVSDRTDTTFRWTRFEDGATTTLPQGVAGDSPTVSVGGDLVAVRTRGRTYRLMDMAGGGSVDIDTTPVGPSADLWQLAGDTLVMRRYDGPGRHSLHLVSRPADRTVHRAVTGLPADADIARVEYSPSGVLVVQYRGTAGGTTGEHLAVVDLAGAKVVEDRAVPRFYPNSGVSVTDTHLAWAETNPEGDVTLVTARRGAAESTRLTTFEPVGRYVSVSLLGDWVTYGVSEEELSAVSLKDGTTTGPLLDGVRDAYGTGDGLLAQGTTPEHRKGVYRIVAGADGRPTVAVVATNGVTTPLTMVNEQVPATAGFARAGAKAVLRWRFGRGDVWVRLRLTHKASGRSWTAEQNLLGASTEAVFDWEGTFTYGTAAHNGAYTWKMTVAPLNDVGERIERTGTLEVASGTAQHDYSDSGSPDLLLRDAAGRLASYDTRQFTTVPDRDWERTDRGAGWHVYDRLLAPGNLDASPYSDVVARDKGGVLWFYSGTGHSLAKPTRVGGGWGIYDKLAAGSDLTGDGRPDLVATDRTGVLWLYRATGSAASPFAARKRIGGGWGVYDTIVAAGNLGGAKAGDLLARDRSGVLWLYLGKGDGTFAPRTRIGGGWNAYKQLVGVGDIDRDGRPDLLAEIRSGDTSLLTHYKGTGDWKAPFARPVVLNVPAPYSGPAILF
ncbi:FG-GAP repeat domain-containing protein [Streptomyces sp. NPDC017254]|uniref:FG-GAP repeat domain-containing protein n=1 Tax=unclassified Streptomyces TaxID=2593676 RepID=UPI0037B08097